MSPSPPANRIGGKPSVGGPDVALIFLQSEEPSNVLGKSYSFEDTHVFAAGGDKRTFNFRINEHYSSDNKIFLARNLFFISGNQKISPKGGLRSYLSDLAGRYWLIVSYHKVLLKIILN